MLDEDSYLVPELDGVRILSRTSHEFLHEIPGETGQVSPPSLGPFFRVSVYWGLRSWRWKSSLDVALPTSCSPGGGRAPTWAVPGSQAAGRGGGGAGFR